MSMITWCHTNNTAWSQCLFHRLHGRICLPKWMLISTNFTHFFVRSSAQFYLFSFCIPFRFCRKEGWRWWKWRPSWHSKEDNACQRCFFFFLWAILLFNGLSGSTLIWPSTNPLMSCLVLCVLLSAKYNLLLSCTKIKSASRLRTFSVDFLCFMFTLPGIQVLLSLYYLFFVTF